MKIIESPDGNKYQVGGPIGGTDEFSLYECVLPDKGIGIFKISKAVEYNGCLDKEAYVLDLLRNEALRLKDEYARKVTTDKVLNYQLFFPDLIESFICESQDNRRVNIVCMNKTANKLGELAPLSYFKIRMGERMDPRTSAWILGKLLKVLVFAHSQNISIGNLSGDNILINKKEHYVM